MTLQSGSIPKHPERSRIVGVSKNKKRNGGNAGLGLYSLEGRQLQYILHDRLNNADLRYDFPYRSDRIDIVGASNRDKRAISVFSVDENRLKLLADLPIKDEAGRLIDEEPYGFCLALDKTKEYCPLCSLSYEEWAHLSASNNGRGWYSQGQIHTRH